jgi:hypothetical protein
MSVAGHLGVLAAAALTLALFLLPGHEHGGIDSFDGARFADMVGGTASRPFVYRALLPQTVGAVGRITPDRFELAVASSVRDHRRSSDAFARLGWQTDAAYQYLVAALLMYLCLVGFAYFCARLAWAAGEPEHSGRSGASLAVLALYGLTPFFIYGSHVYDPPQILLYTASLYFLARLAIWRFLLLFALTALNKETALLLVPIFAVFSRPLLPRRRYLQVLVGLSAVYLAIRIGLWTVFRGNPGGIVESHLVDHGLAPATWVKMYARTPYFALLLAAAFLLWSRRPRFLKIALIGTLPPLAALALFLGYVDEWRGYYEAYPVVFALAADLLRRVRRPEASFRA